MVQGELFREQQTGIAPEPKRRSFLAQYEITITLDKLLIGSVGLMVGLALVYSFGVEKGKRAMERRLETYLSEKPSSPSPSPVSPSSDPLGEEVLVAGREIPADTSEVTASAPAVPAPETREKGPVLPLVDQARTGAYTIQLVTYVSKAQALKEIEKLKAQGFNGFVIPSGPYFQVCVNYFEKKDLAQIAFKRLEASGRYPGAYVRPVIR